MQVHIVYRQNNDSCSQSPQLFSVMAAVSNVNTAQSLAKEHNAEVDTVSFHFEKSNQIRIPKSDTISF